MVAARFTPSLLDHDTLERLFVSRYHILDDILGRIQRAASSEERGNKLLTGPRGAGKTHLLSLVYHRARQIPGFGDSFRLAWLPEDMWTIASLDDLLDEILRRIEPSVDHEDLSTTDRQRVLTLNGPVVVLIENLDHVLHAIGDDGQRRLRALLENERPALLIATTTRLGSVFLDQSQPFYGFFSTTDLEPFNIEDASAMLRAIATENGDLALAERLDQPRARRRLEAVGHLAGGQPRVWALLAAGLTADGLEELVHTLIERFDDLTPYYQEQLARLSVHERKIVSALARMDAAVSITALSERTRIDQRSLARTITDLRRKGWVKQRSGLLVEMSDRRRSYYQLAEPLARLAFQLKESRGEPVALVVDFLKLWFDSEALAAQVSHRGELVDQYRRQAVELQQIDHNIDLLRSLVEITHPSAYPTAEFADELLVTHSPQLNPETSQALLDLDEALARLDAGDPDPLLGMPPPLSQLLEARLEDGATIEALRIELARLAAEAPGPPEEWVRRLEALAGHNITRDERAMFEAALAVHLTAQGRGNSARALLDGLADQNSSEAVLWAGRGLLAQGDAENAKRLLERCRPGLRAPSLRGLGILLSDAYRRCEETERIGPLWEDITGELLELSTPEREATHEHVGLIAQCVLTIVIGTYVRCLIYYQGGRDLRSGISEAITHRTLGVIASVLERSEAKHGGDDQLAISIRSVRAEFWAYLGRHREAETELRTALDLAERSLGSQDPATVRIRETLQTWQDPPRLSTAE